MTEISELEALINEVNGQIDQSSADLAEARESLSQFVSDDYKTGNMSLLDIILSSKSFDEFISQVVYANKIAESERRAIEQVDTLYTNLMLKRDQLAQYKAEREAALVEETARLENANKASEEATKYYEALNEQQKVTYQHEVQVQREQAAEQTKQILQSIASDAGITQAPAATDGGTQTPALTEEQTNAVMDLIQSDPSVVESLVGDTSSDGGTTTDAAAAAVSTVATAAATGGSTSDSEFLSRVYSLLGAGYQWSGYNYTGSADTSSFTCSGVVDYALGRDSQSSSPETLYSEVGSDITTDTSSLQAGDLVFYSYGDREVGHVAVYVGDGYVIDSIPNGGVAVREVDYMDVVGGGSLS
ncbi:MAG: NlpC/P60 family protein [Coriobacteriales bacterium]|nr:NlpC/P60 family protein [Coriobacteriales bacterium]